MASATPAKRAAQPRTNPGTKAQEKSDRTSTHVMVTRRAKAAAVAAVAAVASVPAAENPYDRVQSFLGDVGLQGESVVDLHERLREGFESGVVVHLVDQFHAIKPNELWPALGISERTFHRLKSESTKRLDADKSGRAWALAEVLSRATEVLGSKDAAERWLAMPALALGSRRPIDMMETNAGAEAVRTLLEQLEYGVYV
jgi:putative toxin-antitoxin system antitoxin component (TIGR02293 family)